MVLCDGATGYAPVLACANDITLGLFGLGLVTLTWVVIYFRTRTNAQPRDAATAASFIAFMVAVLLRLMGALSDYVLGGAFALMVLSVAVLAFVRRA